VEPQFHEVFVVGDYPSPLPIRHDRGPMEPGQAVVSFGAPAYSAPEQLLLGAPDVLTDVYGLGGILFEMLYDRPPNGENPASIVEILNALAVRKGPPKPPPFGRRAARSRELARRLQPICLRALESDRTARQVSVSAFMEGVERCAWGSIG
jgi:serine/threonine protein kinase